MANLMKKPNADINELEQLVIQQWPQELDGHFSYTIALSGGIDSVVLLFLLNQIKPSLPNSTKLKFNALHINHGISNNANQWEDFCISLCHQLDINLTIAKHQVTKLGGESLENNARQIRYNEFFNCQDEVIVLAHHQNDQVETILSQIFRGSNIHNIAAMKLITHKQNKIFFRPLINIPKEMLQQYAQAKGLKHIEDESNLDTTFLRNFIRHNILPQLISFDSNVTSKIANIGEQLQHTLNFIATITIEDFTLAKYDNRSIGNPFSSSIILDTSKIISLSQERQLNILAYYLKCNNLPLPSSKQQIEFMRQVTYCAIDKHPSLLLNNNYKISKHNGFIGIES
jgi:tRNA(Ile)-lysidine synthase